MSERTKAGKDLLQAASLASYFLQTGQAEVFNTAWREALGRGRGWQARAEQGKETLMRIAPELDEALLWQS